MRRAGIGMADRVGKRSIGKIVESRRGIGVISLGHWMLLGSGRAGWEVDASPRLANTVYAIYALVNTAYAKCETI